MKKADIILKSSAVFTGLSAMPQKGAVIINENRIIASVSWDDMETYIGPQTILKDYGAVSYTHLFVQLASKIINSGNRARGMVGVGRAAAAAVKLSKAVFTFLMGIDIAAFKFIAYRGVCNPIIYLSLIHI